MGGSDFHLEVMDVASCLLIHVLFLLAFCSSVEKEEEKRGAKPSRLIVARRGRVMLA